jgi:hypothetical protein
MSPRVQNLLSLVVLAAAFAISSYPEKPGGGSIQVAEVKRVHDGERAAR